MIILSLLAGIGFSLVGSGEPADTQTGCKSGFGERIADIFSEASFIALFTVNDIEAPLNDARHGNVSMSLVQTISGDPPLSIKTVGVEASVIPPGYFDLTYSHEQIVQSGFANAGMSVISQEVGCAAVPAEGFVRGYFYLVLGGVESRISYEPILSERDPLLLYLLESTQP